MTLYIYTSFVDHSPSAHFSKLLFFLFYFIVFWLLKRLGRRKRHKGFLALFALLSVSFGGFLSYFIFPGGQLIAEKVPYRLVVSAVVFVFVLPAWYLLAKRKVWEDVKLLFALLLLSAFKTKRVLLNVGEANNVAKSIIFLPYMLVKAGYFLVKLVSREILGGFGDFFHALGFGK